MKQYLILFSLISSMAVAQQLPSVAVVGQGIVYATPDVVNISISIEREGDNPKELRQKNGETVAKVLQAISQEQLPIENFQTDYVSLNKQYDYNTKLYKYHISQNLRIKLEDLSKYESLMEALFEAGVNRINGIDFEVKNNAKLLQDARIAAIDDARKKALLYAVTLDQNIGKAISISETSSYANVQPVFRAAKMLGETSDQTTLAVGQIAVEAQINVTFELLK